MSTQDLQVKYPVITLGKSYIPVDQLSAKGAYNRYMEVPSDIIPTIGGILGVRDDGNIAMATMDNTNKLYVNGGTGGGGGTTGGVADPTKIAQIFNYSGFGEQTQDLGACNTIYDIHGHILSVNVPTRQTQTLDLLLRSVSNGNVYTIIRTATDYSVMPTTVDHMLYEFSFIFPSGMKLSDMQSWGTDIQLVTSGASTFYGTVFVQVCYSP